MKTEDEIRIHVTEKAQADSAFRARLIADPRAVVEAEFQVTVPGGFKLLVHEETQNSAHLVLPPTGGRLSPEAMRTVAGGSPTGQPGKW